MHFCIFILRAILCSSSGTNYNSIYFHHYLSCFWVLGPLLLQFINDLHGLISPPAPGTPIPLILLGKVNTHSLFLWSLSYSCVTRLTVLVISVKKYIAINFLVSGSICVAWKDRDLQGIKSFVLCSRSVFLEMRQWRENVLRFLFCFTQNKERTELLGRISLFCWMGSSICTTLVEVTSHLTICMWN